MVREIHIVKEIYKAIRHLVQPSADIEMNVGVHSVTFKGTQIEIVIELTPIFNNRYMHVDGRLIEHIHSFSKSEHIDIFTDQYIDKSVTVYYKEYTVECASKFPAVFRAIKTLIQEMKNAKIGF